MTTQSTLASDFRALHRKGNPLILFNVWDAGSASTVADAGAKALATGSAPVAMAHGFADGENMPLDLVLENLKRIIAATNLPVSTDLEGGYGAAPEIVAQSVTRAIKTGAVGFNFEDQIVGTSELYDLDTQALRIVAARTAADAVCQGVFINARTDIFLKAPPETHTDAMLDAAITRAKTFADAGGDGFFAPGLADADMIEKLCAASPVPVNIIALPHVPDTKILTECGVSRISYGPVSYRRMTAWLAAEAKAAMGQS